MGGGRELSVMLACRRGDCESRVCRGVLLYVIEQDSAELCMTSVT